LRPNHCTNCTIARLELKLGDLLAVYMRQRISKFQPQTSLESKLTFDFLLFTRARGDTPLREIRMGGPL
jgi:hypothetical protein